jgi:hypothetical protein
LSSLSRNKIFIESIKNQKGGRMKKLFLISLAMTLLISVVSRADVVVKTKSSADMAGMMTTNSDGTNTIKGDKSYNSTTTEVTGGMAAMFSKGKPKEAVNITRLDKGLFWNLEPEKKIYTETTMEQLKKQMAEARGEGDKEKESEYAWTVDVKSVDGSQTINGFKCNGVIGKATGVSKKNAADTIFITYEQWAAKEVPGSSEVQSFQKDYAKAMGIDEMWGKENTGAMLKQYGAEFGELAVKVSESGGYPIRTIISVEGGAKPEGEGSNQSPSGALGMMNKMLGKKADKPEGDKGGRMKSFSMTNEVLSIEQKSVDDSQFEIPAGYKKK